MPQFFIKSNHIDDKNVLITNKDDIRHLKNVLRLKAGESLNLIDENGYFYETKITEVSSN